MLWARQFGIAVGIAVFFPMLVSYGVSLIRPYPHIEHQVYVYATIAPTTPEGWKAYEEENQARNKREQERRDAIDKARQPFYWLLFLIATPLGIAATVAGSYLKIVSVGTGLIFGGMMNVLNGVSGYWEHLTRSGQIASLLLGLCLIAFVVYRQVITARHRPV